MSKSYFRTPVATGLAKSLDGAPRVDREAGVIRGYAVMTKGPIPTHDFHADDITLDQLVEFSNAAPGGREVRGVKSRFTHPGLSADGMGKYLGRSSNFRRDGDVVRADLKLSDISHRTPDGDLGGYVLDLADEDPEAFGASVVVDAEPERDDKGVVRHAESKHRLMRIKRLWASDVVDDPAANPGGFFDGSRFDSAARYGDAILDNLFPDATGEDILGRLEAFGRRYCERKGKSVPTEPAVNPPTEPVANPPAPLSAPPTAPPPAKPPEPDPVQAERERCSKIRSLCDQAGFSSLAGGLIDAGATVEQCQAQLFQKLCETRPPIGGTGDPTRADADSEARKEYEAGRKDYDRLGVTFKQFKASRALGFEIHTK